MTPLQATAKQGANGWYLAAEGGKSTRLSGPYTNNGFYKRPGPAQVGGWKNFSTDAVIDTVSGLFTG